MYLSLALALLLQVQPGPYADSATAALIARARARHREQDAAVHDYRARLVTRLDVSAGMGSFARFLPLGVEEQESELHWQAPNDVKVVVLGRRYRTAFSGADINSSWTRPWFVPRFLGDSIRLLSSEDFPPRAAIHPLSEGAAAYYRYAIADSMQIMLPGRTVRAIGVRFTPIRADASLVAGEVWLDAATAETVRLTMTFVGKRIWSDSIGPSARDSARADHDESLAQRILRVSADLEYGLYRQRYWLPYRQIVTLDVRLPWFKNIELPIHFITTFRDVQVNGNQPIVFSAVPADTGAARRRDRRRGRVARWCGDSSRAKAAGGSTVSASAGAPPPRRHEGCVTVGTWPGGRYEVDVPPDSALLAFDGWSDSLQLGLSDADAAQVAALEASALSIVGHLPDSLTGRRALGVAFDKLTDLWRYNRAEGPSLGWGYEWRPGAPYLTVLARARYPFTDRRLEGAVTVRRDGPRSRLEVMAFREMRDADPVAPGLSFANSVTSLLLARDDGAYVFVEGGELRYRRPVGRMADVTLEARYGAESAPRRLAHSGVNDLLGGSGDFPPNAPVRAGRYVVARAALAAGWRPVSWHVGVEATGGAATEGRAWVTMTARSALPFDADLAAFGFLGGGVGDSLPQREFRLGGDRTLRGYAAGALRGASAWAAGVDLAFGRDAVAPVLFADAGQVAPRRLQFGGGPAVSVGAGLSLFRGTLRFNAARPIAPHAAWRLSLVIGARR